MLNKIKEFFNDANKNGLSLPMASDSSTGKPSVTLLAFYLGMCLSVVSLLAYHVFVDKLIGPTSMTLLFFAMTFVFYRLRSLDKVKINLTEKSIEFEDSPEAQKEEK